MANLEQLLSLWCMIKVQQTALENTIEHVFSQDYHLALCMIKVQQTALENTIEHVFSQDYHLALC